ncbi:MAG TPA: hypothetical protein VI893_05835 [Thermoplasmata archaeon]|nr:hypothetical protein [Thermoplasmata archaeon]
MAPLLPEPQICRLGKLYFDYGYTVVVDCECPNMRRGQFECPRVSNAAPECRDPKHLVPHLWAKKGDRTVIAHVLCEPDLDEASTKFRLLNFLENAEQVIAYVPWMLIPKSFERLKEWNARGVAVEGWGPTEKSKTRDSR